MIAPVPVEDIDRLTNGDWRYVADSDGRHLVRHEPSGIAWWVESQALIPQVIDDTLDYMDKLLVHTLIARNRQALSAEQRRLLLAAG